MTYYIYAFLLLSIFLIVYMSMEARMLKVERVNLARGKENLKIIQLSDIHISKLRVSPEKVKKVLDKEKPDLVIITGDYIESEKDIASFEHFMRSIKCKSACYLCFGNHDYRAFNNNEQKMKQYENSIQETGAEFLNNRQVYITKNNKIYNIIGIKDLQCMKYDRQAISGMISDHADMNIALTHNPDIVLDLPSGKIDLLLAGHFHGGQIWAPFNIEMKLMRKERICKMGIKRGLHRVNGITLYINRGLGNVIVPFRFFSKPEITVFYLL